MRVRLAQLTVSRGSTVRVSTVAMSSRPKRDAAFGVPIGAACCSSVWVAMCHIRATIRVTSAPLCCQERSFDAWDCALVLVAVKVVRPVGRSTLTAPARRRGGWLAEAAWGVRGRCGACSVGFAGPGSG